MSRPASEVHIRQAAVADAPTVLSVLEEAARWLRDRGIPLWFDSELRPEDIMRHTANGQYFLAEVADTAAGTFRFDLTDPEFWPEVPEGESAFIHRLAVRRRFAGGRVSAPMLGWAARHARELGRDYLRLDCEADRPRLRAFYENLGFQYHSDCQVGPFHLARYQLDLREIPPSFGTPRSP